VATYDYPDDLLTAQRALHHVRAELDVLYGRLPYSVEPMEGWQRPEGYWLATSPPRTHSPGWSSQEQRDVTALRRRARELSAAIVTHAFWESVPGPERPGARSALKYSFHLAANGETGA
jgi:hypothetical protein